MSGELSIRKDQLTTLAAEHGLEDLLKPMVQEIHLFDTYIAGTALMPDAAVLNTLKPKELLTLRREESRFDSHTVAVLKQDGTKLGRIPEMDEIIFARLMDAGKCLGARVKTIEKHSGFLKIAIAIFLTDF